MTQSDSEKTGKKEAMKRLRESRKEKIAAASALSKKHRKAMEAIKNILKGGGRTVPQMAEATGMQSSEVFWYIAAMKKYGEIAEGDKEGSNFRYGLAGETARETDEQASGRDRS
jgi:predicted transcriptional regulator